MIPNTSGTSSFKLSVAECIEEAFDRIQVRATQITVEMMVSLSRSLNIMLQDWSGNRGINLWKVKLFTINLIQGISTYELSPTIINMLDSYLRQIYLGTPSNFPVSLSTVTGSNQVTVNWPNHGLSVGQFMGIQVPLSVGGVTLLGYREVISVPNANSLVILANRSATVTVSNGGAVPVFTTAPGSVSINVYFPNHDLLPGQPFNVQVSTICGGLNILGSYTVETVIDQNNFTIAFPMPASFAQTQAENGGMAGYSAEIQNAQPTDIILYPISRNDYAMLPDKFVQGRPTSYWFDRIYPPKVTLWQVPDGSLPYQLRFYALVKIEDAAPVGAQNPDVVERFYEALCAELAAKAAEKYAPDQWQPKVLAATAAWNRAADADREMVSSFITPELDGYFS